MTNRSESLVAFALCAFLAPASASAEAAPVSPTVNVVRGIEVVDVPEGVELAIRGTRAPSYTVYKLQDPPRLIVDLSGADVSAIGGPVAVGRRGVREVATAQYKDDKSSVGRVVIALEGAPRYEVTARGEAVIVKVQPDAAPSGSVSQQRLSDQAPRQARGEREQRAQRERERQAQGGGEAAPAGGQAQGERSTVAAPPDNVVSRRVDEAEVEHPATAITSARPRGGGVVLALDGQVARFEVIELANPARLVIDLHEVVKAPRHPVALDGAFSQVRFGRDAGKVRVVLDAAGDLPPCEVKRVKGGLAVVPAATDPIARSSRPAPLAPSAGRGAAGVEGRAPPTSGGAVVDDLRFSQSEGAARIEIPGTPAYAVTRPDERTLVLTLRNARLVKKLERTVDAAAFRGPVALMSSFNQAGGDAKIVLSLRGEATDFITHTDAGIAWTIRAAGMSGGEAAETPRALVAEAQAAAATGAGTSYTMSGPVQRREYTGRRITLDFHDIDIRNLLRLIADVSKKNIVVADDVTGKVTVSLRNVPWDQALDLVLRSKGLDKEEMGNVIRIAKVETIAKEQQARAEAARARAPLIPLKVRLLPVNFARAADVATRVKDVLSERGSVSTDDRTNVLIVKDVPEALSRAEGLVRNLDTETPQVRIESRIVEASSNYNRSIGVQWGGSATWSPGTGNPTGLFFPNIVNAGGAAGGLPTIGTTQSLVPGYAVNLPAAIGQGQGGGMGFTFGSASGAFNLNLVLSALENNGVVKTISAPSVSTVDNKEATIGQGLSIPFSQVSAAGVNTMFIEAKLELKVTPHVSADGSILMKIKVTNNAPNPQLTGANGQPSISKREAETESLVKDGGTTVIGGIYTRQTSSNVAEVPFLGRIPILGYFFRNNTETDDHNELLIFITPRIINRQAMAAVSQ